MLSMGFAASAAEVTITGNDFSAVTDGATTATKDGITIEAKKGSGPTAPALNPYNDVITLRAYATNTITISGEKITKVVFNLNTSTGYKRYAKLTASTGTLSAQNAATSADDMDATITWTGDAASVTFTVADKAELGSEGANKAGQVHILSFDVTGEGGENPGPGPDPQPEGEKYNKISSNDQLVDGSYVLVVGEQFGAAISATSSYGRLNLTNATFDGEALVAEAVNAIEIKKEAAGYTMVDSYGRYLSMDTEHLSTFQLYTEPTEGSYWNIDVLANADVKILNVMNNGCFVSVTKGNQGTWYTNIAPANAPTEFLLPALYLKDKSDAINEVNVDNSNAPVEFFNLQGMRINEPAAGQIVIRRQGNQVSKIFVK